MLCIKVAISIHMSLIHLGHMAPPNKLLETLRPRNLIKYLTSYHDLDENTLKPKQGSKWAFCLAVDHSSIVSNVQQPPRAFQKSGRTSHLTKGPNLTHLNTI